MSISDVTVPNDLDSLWMPFTDNRSFKKQPRLFSEADGMYYFTPDGRKVLDVISKGAAGSWQMDNRGETMLNDEFDFGFAVDWMRKDLNICLDEANNNKAKLPITALINQFYCDLQDMGGGRFDTSSLIKRL